MLFLPICLLLWGHEKAGWGEGCGVETGRPNRAFPSNLCSKLLVALTKLSFLGLSVPSFRKGYQNSSCCVSTFPGFLGG